MDESPNVADIQADPEAYEPMFEGKTIVMHSLAAVIMSEEYASLRQRASGFLLLNPVEGPGKVKTLLGGFKVAFQKDNQAENDDYIPPFTQGPRELIRHPLINAKNPLLAARYSTAAAMLEAETPFNGGVAYFEFEDDEFGFQNVGPNMQLVKALGYDAARLAGKHMAPVYRPDNTAQQITDYLNAN